MSDLKVVLYKENHSPRSLELSSKLLYRLLSLLSLMVIAALLVLGYAIYSYRHASGNYTTYSSDNSTSTESQTPITSGGSLEDQNKALQDRVEELNNKLNNQANIAQATREIDKKNPALALFAPIVVDKTKTQDQILIKNITYTPPGNGSSSAVLSFELHNPKPDESSQKGYITVLARTDKGLLSYPNIFQTSGPYLLDFEKGETFNIARFRMVHATFDINSAPDSFQVLIFTRNGELLINELHELKKSGGN